MKIGLYPGSFNPFHNGHLAIAKQILHTTDLDQVWITVSPQNPLKVDEVLLADQDRLKMVEVGLRNEESIITSDFEFKLPKPSYTWRTLQEIRKQYPNYEFSLIIGADNLANFHLWKDYQAILDSTLVFVYPRENTIIDSEINHPNIQRVEMPLLDISATQIRKVVADGNSIDNWVPEEVKDIIEKRGYYRT